MPIRKVILPGTTVLLLVLFLGCLPTHFKTVSAAELRNLIESSDLHSADSWWFVGIDNHYGHFIHKQGPIAEKGYKVLDTEMVQLGFHQGLTGKFPLGTESRILIKLDRGGERENRAKHE